MEEQRGGDGGEPGEGRARGYVTDAGAINLTDAGRARGTSAQGQGAGGAATAHPSPETSAGQFDHSRAETILTSEMESPATTSGRETAAQPARPVTSGNVAARRGGRETFAARAAGTQAEAPADSWQEQASGEHRQAIPETRAAQATPETRAAFGDEGSNQGGRVVTAPVARRSLAPLVAAGVLALLVVAGVGGWLAWRSMQPKTGATVAQPTPAANATAPTKAAEATKVEKVEAASYWFETFDKPDEAAGKRVAETIPTLVSGQRFRFHFMPQERGYLYIIGPGAGGNAQMTLLTAQGAGALKSNLVGAGADFAFPSMNGAKLKLDDTPGSDEFTFIFSPTPLMSPSFLAGKFLHELTPAEVKELEDFRAQVKSDAPAVAVKDDGGEKRVVVSAPQPATSGGKPVIFDVRINHR